MTICDGHDCDNNSDDAFFFSSKENCLAGDLVGGEAKEEADRGFPCDGIGRVL